MSDLAERRASARPVREGGGHRGGTDRLASGELISAGRRAAFAVLLAMGSGRDHSDDLLHAMGPGGALEGLSELDRHLATALVMGVLRWQLSLDRRLRGLFARPDVEVSEAAMVALRLGAFQLLHMDRIPAHAALSESVALVRAAGQEHVTGMVNAVLRRVARSDEAEPARIFETPTALARRLGHPEWMVVRWAREYGYEAARKICEADQREPSRGALFADDSDGLQMDDGSRLVAELAAAAMPEGVSELLVWDCCAAPGGKTAVLAKRLPRAAILATDVSPRRLRGMEERLGAIAVSAGEGGRVRCAVADAAKLPLLEGEFDLVLCDVPCSGTGTLARNPEIRLRLEESALARQAERQRALLTAAMDRVKEGGRLVYSTCSLEVEECKGVVDAVLEGAAAGWRRVDVADLLRQIGLAEVLPHAVRGGALRTLPGVDPVDGFYAVVLERSDRG